MYVYDTVCRSAGQNDSIAKNERWQVTNDETITIITTQHWERNVQAVDEACRQNQNNRLEGVFLASRKKLRSSK